MAELAETVVLGVVPANVPALSEVLVVAFGGARTVVGGCNVAAEGVYKTEVVVAFEPAEADPDAENDVAAAAPVAPTDALACR